MNDFIKQVATQFTAIALAAIGAAGIAFLQSVAAQTGACPPQTASPETVGVLGAAFKSAHSAWVMASATIKA